MASGTSAPGLPLPQHDLGAYFDSLCDFMEASALDSTPSTPKAPLPVSPPVSPVVAILPPPVSPAKAPMEVAASTDDSSSSGEPSTMVDVEHDASTFVFLDFSFYPEHVLIPPGSQAVIQHNARRFLYLFNGADLVATLTADDPIKLSSPGTGKALVRADDTILRPGVHSFDSELFFYFNPSLQPPR